MKFSELKNGDHFYCTRDCFGGKVTFILIKIQRMQVSLWSDSNNKFIGPAEFNSIIEGRSVFHNVNDNEDVVKIIR